MAGGKIDILIEPDVKGFDRKLESGLSGAIGTAGKIGAALGLAVGGVEIGRQVIQVGTDFQSSMNTMAAVSQATADQLDAVRAKARELGSDTSLTATSASDAAAAMTELAKGGFSVEQAMTAAKGTLQLAAAAQVDAAQAATIQAQALQAFSLDASHASRVSDILAGAANASSAEMTDVALALQQAGTVSNQFGVSIDDATTAIAMFANAGITGSDAGTLLKTSLLALTDQGKPAQKAIADLGLTVYDANGKFAGLPLLIEELNQASKRMSKEQYDAATATLFGSDAIRFAGLAATQGSADFEKLREAVTRQGQAAEVAAAQTQGLPGALERFQNTKEEVLLGLFDAIQDDLVKAVDAGAAALEKIGPIAASSFSAATAGAEALVAVVSPVVGAIGDINSALGGMETSAIVAATALAGLNAINISARMQAAKTSVGGFTHSMGELRQGVTVFQDLMAQSGVRISKFDAAMVAAGVSNNQVLASMGTAYSKAVAPMRRFEAAQRQAAEGAKAAALASSSAFDSIDRIGAQAAHSFAASGARIAGTARGSIAGAFGAIKAGASSVVNALGGPWAVGLAAASFAVAGLVDGLKRMNSALKEMNSEGIRNAESLRNIFEALATGGEQITAVEKNVDSLMSSLSTMADNGPNWFHRGLLAIEDGLNSVVTVTSEYYEVGTALRQASDDAKAAQEKMAELGLTNRDLAEAASGTADAYDRMHARLADGSRGGEQLAQHLATMREQVVAANESFDRVGAAGFNAALAIADVAEKSGTAADRANKLRLAFMELAGIEISAQEASANLTKELDSVAAKSGAVAGATLNASGNIDVTTLSGVALQEALNGVGLAMTNAVASGENVNSVFERSSVQLEHLRQASGLGAEEWQKLLDAMGLTPEKLTVYAEIQADTAKAELTYVASEIQKLENGKATVNVLVKDEEARASLENFGFTVKEINKTTGEIEVTVSDEQAIERYQWWVNEGMPDIDTSEASMKVFMDTTELEGSAEHAKKIIDALAIEEPSPQAKLIIDDLLSGVDISIGDLARLSSESANPNVDLIKDLFDAGVVKTKEDLDRLTGITAEPKIKADGKQAKDEADAVKGKLDGIKDKSVKITTTFEERRVQYWESIGKPANTFGPTPSRFAHGGRLPTIGPGTGVTDGILGVQSNGAPIAWVDAGEWVINRRSSDQFNRTLAALNRGDGTAAMEALYNELPRHDTGGRVQKVKRDLAPLDGTPYIMGGWSPQGTDCSGAVAMGVNSWVGLPIFHSRMSTVTEGAWLAAKGARPGRGGLGDLVIGWWDRGGGANGHTAMRLPDGTHIESGGNTGGGLTIGRTAGPMDGRGFTNWAHFPGDGSGTGADLSIPELAGISPDFSGFSGGRSVNWGEAAKLHELALKYLGAKVYDTGGILPHGGIAVNLSGKPERVLPPEVAKSFDKLADVLPEAARLFAQAAKDLDKPVRAGSKELSVIGGGFLGKSQVVIDAEQGLVDTRKSIAEETQEIAKAEKELEKARRDLSKAERDNADKIIDAQNRLNKAKKKKNASASEIADAERGLKKAKEDAPDKAAAAAEKIAKQEEELAEAREKASTAAKRLEAAERTVVASYYQALADLIEGVGEHLTAAANRFGEFFEVLAKSADVVEQERQAVAQLRQAQIRNNIALRKSIFDLQVAEWDLHTARASGAISVAQAEKQLEETRKQQALLGATSIEALGGAFDRFRTTGVFAIGQVADSVIANSKAVRAAEWAVSEARAQAAADLHDATLKQALAQFDVAEATLMQANAAEMLRIKTAALTEHAAQLYGLTPNAAQGASAGFSGIGKLIGGLGKIAAGIAAGAAGFAAGGPLGVIPGATIALGGLGELIRGGFDIANNKESIKEAWKGMGIGQKAGVILGSLGGGALAIGGAALAPEYGAEAAIGGAKLADQWIDATLGGMAHGVESKITAIQRETADKTSRLELATDAQKLQIEIQRQQLELAGQAKAQALKAQVEYANLQKQLAEANTKKEMEALTEAARVAASRRDAMLVLAARQEKASAEQLTQLKALVAAAGQGASDSGVKTIDLNFHIPPGVETFSREDLARVAVETAKAVSGVEYVNARI